MLFGENAKSRRCPLSDSPMSRMYVFILYVFLHCQSILLAYRTVPNPRYHTKAAINGQSRSNIVKSQISNKNLNEISLPDSNIDYYWNLNKVAFSLLPLAPGPRRKTIFEEVIRDTLWTLDQIQGVINVNVPVRSTVVKLYSGVYWSIILWHLII